MELIAQYSGKEIWLEELKRPYSFSVHFSGEKFVCAIFANDPTISIEEQNAISEQIIKAGCRCTVCAGYNCSSWDNTIDWAYLATKPNFSPSDKDFVMTSWHESDAPAEILWYTLSQTDFDEHVFKKYLVLFIGSNEVIKSEIKNKVLEIIAEN